MRQNSIQTIENLIAKQCTKHKYSSQCNGWYYYYDMINLIVSFTQLNLATYFSNKYKFGRPILSLLMSFWKLEFD